MQNKNQCAFFSHPDFTVGFGISPNQPPKRVADYTAGWESHPAPKNYIYTYMLFSDVLCVKLCLTIQFCEIIINYYARLRKYLRVI